MWTGRWTRDPVYGGTLASDTIQRRGAVMTATEVWARIAEWEKRERPALDALLAPFLDHIVEKLREIQVLNAASQPDLPGTPGADVSRSDGPGSHTLPEKGETP